MAKGTIIKGPDAYGKEEHTRKSEAKLSQKLQADLESAIIRLFESSAYCDVELIVESDSISAHSCILQARVARFYKFLLTECQVLRKNGFSSITICNASFITIRDFVEKIYKNVEISEVEECILRSLLGNKTDLKDQGNHIKLSESSLKKSVSSLNTLTPEADLFYTPKCSPSEIQKPFSQGDHSGSPIKRKENDFTCYYKIVSVDDVQIDEKTDSLTEKPKDEICDDEDEHLEKELAEQDELFLSFKSIFSKVNKPKANPQPTSVTLLGRKKPSPVPRKKLQSNVLLPEENKKPKGRLPLWRPNPIIREQVGIKIVKENLSNGSFRNSCLDSASPKKRQEFFSCPISQETRKSSFSLEMDVSATGGDSGLETSSSCQPEASPRENTVSETSGVDLTEAAINEDIPHDEETVSTKPVGSTNSSSSSDVGTWDAHEDSRIGFPDEQYNTSMVDARQCIGFEDNNDKLEYDLREGSGFCRDTLNEEEIARLDAMERNIRDCETFLNRERQTFYCFDNNAVVESDPKDSIQTNLNKSDQTISVLESVKDVILQNKRIFSNGDEIEKENNNLLVGDIISGNGYVSEQRAKSNAVSEIARDSENFHVDGDVMCKNQINTEVSDGNYVVLERNNSRECYNDDETFADKHFSSLTQADDCATEVYNMNTIRILNVKTPPCSPRHVCKPPVEVDDEKKTDIVFPEVKSSQQTTNSIIPSVNNFFIDASSLLDEDEIISPPVSLLSFKTIDRESESIIRNEGEEANCNYDEDKFEGEDLSGGEHDKVSQIQEDERRQGDLIFKSSIPHFSRHEIEKTEEAMERLRGGAEQMGDTRRDHNEQVVPSADIPSDCETGYPTEVDLFDGIHRKEEYLAFSLPATLPLDRDPSTEEVNEGKEHHADANMKKIDAESMPIVSGGVLPQDFSNSSSHVSSPHLRRRNESAPIVSGGMEYVEEKKKPERKTSVSQGAAWIVSFNDGKPRKRRQTATTTTSESDLESLELNCDMLDNEQLKETCSDLKEINLCNTQNVNSYNPYNAKETNNEEKPNQRRSSSIEKSASLGYFIEFNKESDSSQTEKEEETGKAKQNAKKNIFSMFIDMNDEPKAGKNVSRFERQNTYDKDSKGSLEEQSEVQEEIVKKPFYMFIESDSPAVKRRGGHTPIQRKMLKSFDGAFEESQDNGQERKFDMRRKTTGNIESDGQIPAKNFKGSSQSLFEVSSGIDDYTAGKEPKGQQIRHSKLPLPLCKSSSLSAVNGDSKVIVWSEKKEQKSDNIVSGETWLRTNDIQITYKGKADSAPDGDEFLLKKGSAFTIPEESEGIFRKRDGRKLSDGRGGFHLRTVEEAKSPFKSPEERDSGVIVTEESDDSFVKLSDMDNYKNPYLETGGKKSGVSGMSKSIPEGSWIENKTFVKNSDAESFMSKSIGNGLVKSNSGTVFPTDKNATRSLNRHLPNMTLSSSFGRKSTSSGGKQDTETSTSEVSEISSMQSSVEPSGLETSTSETEVSCPNGTTKLGEDLLRMFLDEIGPDVIVEVGGRRVKAHKCILSSRCQYFAAMLSGGWVESAGNVISLQGFSYNSVHFALCHIYSGENRIPDSLNIVELATLADMLCLEGLKEVISHTLKVKYCHCFHQPCDECQVGVLDSLPVASAYGLDNLYRKCLRWITKHFVKIWPTKTFASLPKELLDKCYKHHVVHMTVENVLDTILKIDTVRGSLPNVRWSETVSRLVTKLHDAAIKYIADHFSSILTSDTFLALGKEAGWSVERLEDSLMKATKCLPPEQACWSHARLHRILTVAKGPDPPSEMDWNGNFVDLLQCISGHVESSLIKQAPRAAKSKAWRQMEPELRSRIQERACLVLPDDTPSPKPKRTSSIKRESRQSNASSTAARTNSRNLEIRNMKLAMTHQVNRAASLNRLQHPDQRSAAKDLRSLRPAPAVAATKRVENPILNARKPAAGVGEIKKITSSRFMDVKPRYLEPKSPQKTASDKQLNASNIRRGTRPLSSSDSSRNCSPLNANAHLRVGGVSRQHRDSVVSTESATSYEGKKDRSCGRSDNPSAKTFSRLAADDNMSTDSLYTDSLYSEKEATMKKPEESKLKGKENVRKAAAAKPIAHVGTLSKSSSNSPNARKINSENSTPSSYKPIAGRKLTPPASDSKVAPPKRFPAARISNSNQKASPGRASLASPRNVTNRNVMQKAKYDANVINGNPVKNKKDVDVENNKNSVEDDKRPSTVSRSGTFLKDEPTILKKPQAEDVDTSF